MKDLGAFAILYLQVIKNQVINKAPKIAKKITRPEAWVEPDSPLSHQYLVVPIGSSKIIWSFIGWPIITSCQEPLTNRFLFKI